MRQCTYTYLSSLPAATARESGSSAHSRERNAFLFVFFSLTIFSFHRACLHCRRREERIHSGEKLFAAFSRTCICSFLFMTGARTPLPFLPHKEHPFIVIVTFSVCPRGRSSAAKLRSMACKWHNRKKVKQNTFRTLAEISASPSHEASKSRTFRQL